MPPARIELPLLTLRARSPFAIGTGYGRGLIDRTVQRAESGLIYIPASVLKGKTRSACEAVARSCKLGTCSSPAPAQMHANDESCLVCRIFGRPGSGSGLRWHTAGLDEAWAQALLQYAQKRTVTGQTFSRTQVQIDRKRGMAAESHLYTGEFAIEGLRFDAKPALTGWLELTPVSGETGVYYELILLCAGLSLVNTIGGSHSRGAGFFALDLPKTVLVNGEALSVQRQIDLLEALELYQDEWEASR